MTEKQKKVPIVEDLTEEKTSFAEEPIIIADPIEIANRAAAEMKETAQRIQAEFDNYRKRNNDSIKIAKQNGENTILTELFRVTDNFERAIAQVDEKSKEGINLIFKQVLSIFEKFSVEEVQSLGEKFNPEEHNAVLTVDDSENENKVVEVLQKGYRREKTILRTAMVKVAK